MHTTMTDIINTNIQQPQQQQDEILSTHHEKTEQPQPQGDLITPPMSPTNPASSISSSSFPTNNNTNKATTATSKSSLKVTAGQTGLPWLTHDAERTASPIQTMSPEELTQAQHDKVEVPSSPTTLNSPPPKFMARPKTSSIIRVPTRKRTMQKHIYTMKDGLDPVKVLLSRLTNWQISVKYLTSMFHSIKKVESNTGKGYRKIDSKFVIPAKLENQFKSSNGIKDAWTEFRHYTRENSLIHQDFVDFIENEIAPALHSVLKEIGQYKVGLKKNKELRTTILWDYRKRADAVITRLNSDIYATVNQQEKQTSQYIVPKKDPLLTKYVVVHTIQDLYKQENRLHKEFLETQDKYRQFEQEKIINVYIQLFKTLEQYRIDHHLENLEGVSKVVALFDDIEQDAEWLDFLHHHENELVKQSATYKDERALDFPNVGHPLVQPLVLGNLARKHGKKWTKEFYLLSPVGLLHRFKDQENFTHSPTKPDISMFVPQCHVLINPTSQLLELSGKTLGGGLFGGSKKLFELSSSQPHAIKQWIDVLGPMSLEHETAVIKGASGAAGTIAAGGTAGVVGAGAGAMAVTGDDLSVHSKILEEENDHQVQPAVEMEAESSKLGNSAAPEKEASAQAIVAGATIDDTNQTNEIQPAGEQEKQDQIAPITNYQSHTSSTAANDSEDDDDAENYKRETIEYSTHTPLKGEQDEHNPFVTKENNNLPTAAIANHPDIAMNDFAAPNIGGHEGTNKPAGPTREGSDLYWDTKTSVTAL